MDEGKSILLIDDHDLILQGVKSIIDKLPEISRLCTASSGKETQEWLSYRRFDLYILDIDLPDISGFELINRIKSKDPNARIIINTIHDEMWNINRFLQLEVHSVILKSSNIQEIKEAILSVLAGNRYYCSHFELLRNKLKNLQQTKELSEDSLTTRELEVLQAIAEGFSTNEIAERLHLSDNTIETYRKRMMLKLNARNAVDLVMKAMGKGIISLKKH